MANYFPELPKSTYSASYQHSRPTRFKAMYNEIPSMIDQPTVIQPPREFPIEPYGPYRVNRLAQAPAAGLGSKGIIHRTTGPKEIAEAMDKKKQEDVERQVVDIPRPDILGLPVISGGYFKLPIDPHLDRGTADDIYKHRVFNTTSGRAMQECAFPVRPVEPPSSTREERPDMVRMLPEKYEQSVAKWQRVPLWDKIQSRSHLHIPETNPALERARQIKEEKLRQAKQQDDRITTQIRSWMVDDALSSSYTLQHSGYMGFMPRWPTGKPMQRPTERPEMVTVSQATHRKFPPREYYEGQFGRDAPMSSQVTLTYPYNPFNKIEVDTEFVALPT